MPKLAVNGCLYNYEEQGAGDRVIFFGHGLLYSWQSFEQQIAHFAAKGYRVIGIDWRGQGESESVGAPEDYSLYQLGQDAVALLTQLGVKECHWVGLSMGGMVAMRVYPQQPGLFRSLSLIDTSAADDPEHLPMYTQMVEAYRQYGLIPQIQAGLDNVFYTPAFPEKNPVAVEYWHNYWHNANREGMYYATLPVINRDDVSEQVNQISVPTLVVVGEQDISTPPARSEDLHRQIAGSKLVKIAEAGHMSSVEQPQAVTQALDEFITALDS